MNMGGHENICSHPSNHYLNFSNTGYNHLPKFMFGKLYLLVSLFLIYGKQGEVRVLVRVHKALFHFFFSFWNIEEYFSERNCLTCHIHFSLYAI